MVVQVGWSPDGAETTSKPTQMPPGTGSLGTGVGSRSGEPEEQLLVSEDHSGFTEASPASAQVSAVLPCPPALAPQERVSSGPTGRRFPGMGIFTPAAFFFQAKITGSLGDRWGEPKMFPFHCWPPAEKDLYPGRVAQGTGE